MSFIQLHHWKYFSENTNDPNPILKETLTCECYGTALLLKNISTESPAPSDAESGNPWYIDSMKQIYDYDDYQKFLYDFYEEKKQSTSFFSFRYMADKTGIDAGFLSKVCNGKEHLSLKSVDTICSFLKLDKDESTFFAALVRFGRATSSAEIKAFYEEILSLRGVDLHRVSDQFYSFYQKWYHTAIRAILSFYRFKDDYEALAKMLTPEVSIDEVRGSIKLLEQMKFIRRDEDGYYALTNTNISTGDKWRTAAIHGFQEQTIDLAKHSLNNHEKELRDISSVTLSVHHDDIDEIKVRAQDFRRSLMQMKTDNGESDMVYQVNIQIIPMTKREDQ